MTEVRTISDAGQSLFATEAFKAGQIILEEDPLLVCHPNTPEQIKAVRSQFENIKASIEDSSSSSSAAANKKKNKSSKSSNHSTSYASSNILHDVNIPSTVDALHKEKFRSMLTAAASYALLTSKEMKAKLQKLYAPSLTDPSSPHETSIVSLSKEALTFLQRKGQVKPNTPLSDLVHETPDVCQTIMLVWACNAFQGGYIYETTSRINHSCDFNAVVSMDAMAKGGGERQVIRAATDIKPGDEITISYLGSITYADCQLRNERLLSEKYFQCFCTRCRKDRTNGDVAAAIPCTVCHERAGRYLDEDVQYDDGEVEVNYCLPRCKEVNQESAQVLKYEYVCPKCGPVEVKEPISTAMEKAIERAMSHLEKGLMHTSEIDDDEGERDVVLEMTERLSCLSSSVLGSKHYLSNLLTCVMLGRKLSALNAAILCNSAKGSSPGDSDSIVDTTEVAECIHSLEQLSNYVESLNLKSHPGHLTGNLNVGVARVLIGFGDLKSMKYGSTFIAKVLDDYFKLGFEGDGMIKVVETLSGAWKRKAGYDEEDREQKKKRMKV